MRGGIGELLQFLVISLKLLAGVLSGALGFAAFSDITEDENDAGDAAFLSVFSALSSIGTIRPSRRQGNGRNWASPQMAPVERTCTSFSQPWPESVRSG